MRIRDHEGCSAPEPCHAGFITGSTKICTVTTIIHKYLLKCSTDRFTVLYLSLLGTINRLRDGEFDMHYAMHWKRGWSVFTSFPGFPLIPTEKKYPY